MQHKYQIHDAAHGTGNIDIVGGVFLSLDMTKAFDNVSRSRLWIPI